MRTLLLISLLAIQAHTFVKDKTTQPIKMNFDFFVKNDEGSYQKEYSTKAIVEDKEEVLFSYNNRVKKDSKGIKVSIKPYTTTKGTHLLVKYYKRNKGKFYLYSKSIINHTLGNDSKIQIIDGKKVYKLLISSEKH